MRDRFPEHLRPRRRADEIGSARYLGARWPEMRALLAAHGTPRRASGSDA